MTLFQTPSQTVGPFFHYGLVFGGENILASNDARGQRIALTGRVLDGDSAPIADALVEIWQADAAGIYAHPEDPRRDQADPHFRSFGRSDTTYPENHYRFETVKPGRVPAGDGTWQAPHVCARIFARGLLLHLTTRLYFSDESAVNAVDSVLAHVPSDRRCTLLAARDPAAAPMPVYRLDLVLQGPRETVFFEA